MKLEPSDIYDLKPVIAAVVTEVLDRMEADAAKLNGKLAHPEPEAANLLGIPQHTLRDCRLRGEITGSRVGKKTLYERQELLAFLRRRRLT